MFRSIYKKLCTANRNQIGVHLSHCNDWWGDGSGDMLFVRSAWNKAWIEWAKEPLQPAEEPKHEDKPTIVKPKDWLFQFTTGRGEYLGRVTISSAKMPTTKEAVEEFAKVAPSAAKFVGKNGAEIITDKEQCLGDVPIGSTVYSNISGGNLKVVKHRRDYVVVLHLDGPKANLYSYIDSQYPVVVKKLGDSKAPAKKISADPVKLVSTATGNNGFSVSFAEDHDGVEMNVKKSKGANGIAVTYTLDQLRQLSDAINEYLARRPLTGDEVHMPRRVGLYRYDHGVDGRWFALGYFKSVGAAVLSAFDNATRFGLNKPDVWTLIREIGYELPPIPDGPRPADAPGIVYSINRQIK